MEKQSEIESTLRYLAREIRKGQAVVFVGAGFSVNDMGKITILDFPIEGESL